MDKKKLLNQLQSYAKENRLLSYWYLISTVFLFSLFIFLTITVNIFTIKLMLSLITGLILLRLSIFYHDFQHGSFLRNEKWLKPVMTLFGILILTPPSIWRQTHNFHHRFNGKLFGPSLGAFPLVTKSKYFNMTSWQKTKYHFIRHPITMIFAYFTLFYALFLIYPLAKKPFKHIDCLIALIINITLIITTAIYIPQILMFIIIIPGMLISMISSYAFYAQHNFPQAKFKINQRDDFFFAALNSTSFMNSWKITHWFTANIGYHHIHHLNPKIPFYNLPKVYAEIPELQIKNTISLMPKSIYQCLTLTYWDDEKEIMI